MMVRFRFPALCGGTTGNKNGEVESMKGAKCFSRCSFLLYAIVTAWTHSNSLE